MKKLFYIVFFITFGMNAQSPFQNALLASQAQATPSVTDIYGDYAASALFPNSTNDRGWTAFNGGSYNLETTNVRTGTTALRGNGGTQGNSQIYNSSVFTGVSGGTTVTWEGWVKVGAVNSGGTMVMQLYDDGDASFVNYTINTSTSDWQFFSISKTRNNSSDLLYLVIIYADGTLYGDDFLVYTN